MMVTIDIISGFLGAGKTTFIKHYVDMLSKEDKAAAEKTAILENEFGAIAFDSEDLESLGLPVETIKAGCICCSGSGDLSRNILFLIEKYSPDRIIIEPTGVARLSDIKRVFAEAPLSEKCRIGRIVTIVDALNYSKRMLISKVFFEDQIKASPVILLSKTETIGSQEKADLSMELARINSSAVVLSCSYDSFTLDLLEIEERATGMDFISTTTKKVNKEKTVSTEKTVTADKGSNILQINKVPRSKALAGKTRSSKIQGGKARIDSISVQWEQSAQPDDMQRFLESLIKADSSQILRIKGVFTGSDAQGYTISYTPGSSPVIVSDKRNAASGTSVGDEITQDEKNGAKRTSDPSRLSPIRITIIGTELDESKIKAAARECALLPQPV